jgi:hypothetical protein
VVGIALGVGAGEGARPLPTGGDTAKRPPRPACGLLPRPKAAGAVPGLIPWGNDNLPERTDRALIVCSLTGIKTVSRGGGLLTVD